jgi:ribonuclease III
VILTLVGFNIMVQSFIDQYLRRYRVRVEASLLDLEKSLDYEFTRTDWIAEALVHRSALSQSKIDELATKERVWNERLEFLGDSVVNLVMAEYLCAQGRFLSEGDMSKIRSALVCESTLARVARERLKLDQHLILGGAVIKASRIVHDSILADAFEAVIGAVFSDAGFETARRVVLKLFSDYLELGRRSGFNQFLEQDHKTLLQEAVQAKFRMTPQYAVVKSCGPAHNREFEVAVSLELEEMMHEFGRGIGPTKKKAAQEAAKVALVKFKELNP